MISLLLLLAPSVYVQYSSLCSKPCYISFRVKARTYCDCKTLQYGLLFLPLLLLYLLLVHSAPVTIASLLLFKHTSHIPILGSELAVLSAWNTPCSGTCMPNSVPSALLIILFFPPLFTQHLLFSSIVCYLFIY